MTLTALAACLAIAGAVADGKVYVVASDQPAFAEAAKAAIDALGGSAELLRADESAKASLAGATVVVVVGPLADRVVSGAAANAHVVECLTPKATAQNNVSVPLRPSPSDVFGLVHLVLPAARKIGVFPAPGSSTSEIAAAGRDAGVEVMFPRGDEAFSAAVDRLVDAADVVWIEDTSAVPSGGAPLVVKKASDARKQVIGPNRATVLQGAFFAIVPDPVAHGRAAGEAAARLLKGDDVRAVPPPSGRIVMNGALARAFSVKLPATMQRRAEIVE